MTEDQIDLAAITDVQQLKALAYDRIVQIQLLQRDYQMVEQRINELQIPLATSNGLVSD